MATSIRELGLDYLYPGSHLIDQSGWDFEWSFMSNISRRAKDPSFFPCLARLESPAVRHMLSICRGRPIESISHPRDADFTQNPLPTHIHPDGVSAARLSISTVVSTEPEPSFESSASTARGILRKASEKGLVVKHLKITVVGPRVHATQNMPPESNWGLWWVLRIAERGGCEHIESLHIAFDPPLPSGCINKQHLAIEKAVEFGLSNLTYAVVGSPEVEWRRHVRIQTGSVSHRLPYWTPRPNYGGYNIHYWWLRKSGIRMVTVLEDALLDVVIRLRDLMLTRWDDESIPSVEEIHKDLKRYLARRKIMSTAA
ncbi:hypothetical protein FRC07_005188 [Ceratobasidium sp. 392]|nr:hypothetical protein FRC07_005188 [Ceratobasidium sp. 392]